MFCNKCQIFWTDALSVSIVPEAITSCQDVRWKRYEKILHRNMRELKHSSDSRCSICRAILFAPNQYERDSMLADDDEPLDIVIDIDPSRGPHQVVSVTFYEANSADKTARISKRMLAICSGLLPDEDLVTALNRSAQLDNSSTGADAAFELASYWLKRCLSEHEQCRQARISTRMPFVPTRLLDVSNNAVRLVETKNEIQDHSDEREYVVLSHCWGLIPIIRTLEENYKDHLKDIEPAKLSKTFSEAIHATRKLGYRYIWIDSMCIIQDSKSDWEAEAATMCDVYRNGILTIAAAHAPGGDVGCFQDRDGILQFPFAVTLPSLEESSSDTSNPRRILFTSYGRSPGIGGPVPPLYGRAWVLQEQLLSPRMLIFDGPQLRWECLCNHGSERSPQGGMSRHIGHQQQIRKAINDKKEFFDLPEIDNKEFASRAQLQYWIYTVMDYTHRGMTKPFDRLVAIDGIAQALSRHTKKKYYAGLWDQDFWLGLLWSISHTNEYTPTTTDAFDLEKNKHVRHEEAIAPSWSWVSVTVPVIYPVPGVIYLERNCEILGVQVSGRPFKQTGKLEIRAHFRTGYVDPIYQYANRDAAVAMPHMTTRKPDGSKNLTSYRGRAWHANDFFIFSDNKPASGLNRFSSQNWRLVRGTFRPDEVIDPSTQVTFASIAQRNAGHSDKSSIPTHAENDPLHTWTIALVPTGKADGEYRRVGYAVWEDCAWYGYNCGPKDRPGRNIEKMEGMRGMMSFGDLEHLGWNRVAEGKGTHQHQFQSNMLPDKGKYHKDVDVEEKVVIIV